MCCWCTASFEDAPPNFWKDYCAGSVALNHWHNQHWSNNSLKKLTIHLHFISYTCLFREATGSCVRWSPAAGCFPRSLGSRQLSVVSEVLRFSPLAIRHLWLGCFFWGMAWDGDTLPKFNSSPLKNDGWKTSVLLGWYIFRGYVELPAGRRFYKFDGAGERDLLFACAFAHLLVPINEYNWRKRRTRRHPALDDTLGLLMETNNST